MLLPSRGSDSMNTQELDQALCATLEDGRLSRTERAALLELWRSEGLDAARLGQLRARAFELARQRLTQAGTGAGDVLNWLEELIKLLSRVNESELRTPSRAYFSPGQACLSAVIGELALARRAADICVFTLTDDRIADAIVAAHARGVVVRIITDNDKQYDQGSDVERLRRAGIAVVVDETEYHMHHKFAVLDASTLLNGSYNFTRGAAAFNEENLVVTEEPALVAAFSQRFGELWSALGGRG